MTVALVNEGKQAHAKATLVDDKGNKDVISAVNVHPVSKSCKLECVHYSGNIGYFASTQTADQKAKQQSILSILLLKVEYSSPDDSSPDAGKKKSKGSLKISHIKL